MMYAHAENFILPISHDEVVHGKGSVLGRMPGDAWSQFAQVRAYYGFMWGHPGKKLLFMGQEFAQGPEWSEEGELHWDQASQPLHAGVRLWVRDLNALMGREPALHRRDHEKGGFRWSVVDDAEQSVLAFLRFADQGPAVAVISNFTPVPRDNYRIGLPAPGRWREALNSDATVYGGSGMGNFGAVTARPKPSHGWPCSAALTLPPLATIYLVHEPIEVVS
jgi:1,4-alpha-glucan branching enzyme